jgi:hypothetical protein
LNFEIEVIEVRDFDIEINRYIEVPNVDIEVWQSSRYNYSPHGQELETLFTYYGPELEKGFTYYFAYDSAHC